MKNYITEQVIPDNILEQLEKELGYEYCHVFEQNHSKRFYALINTKYPFYKSLDKELKYWWRIKSLLLKKYPVLKNI